MHTSLLHHIVKENSGDIFYTFFNMSDKIWHIPQKNMKTAIGLYQPSSKNGKLIKNTFPYLYWLKPLRIGLQIVVSRYELHEDFESLLKKIWGDKQFEFSIFEGTPSVHQKITIQISEGSKIWGYCKLSNNLNVYQLFCREQKILNTLSENKIINIPKCLYCKIFHANTYMFIQDTVKTSASKVIHQWTPIHEQFLQNLHKQSSKKLPFTATDFYYTLLQCKQNLSLLPDYDMRVVERFVDNILDEYKDREVLFSVYHADFTPWNMFMEDNELFVFDWEYAQLTYPPYLDYFHFFTQTAIFEKRWSDVQIFKAYSKFVKSEYINDRQYRFYLLDVITRFMLRENGSLHGDTARCMAIWIRLFSLLN